MTECEAGYIQNAGPCYMCGARQDQSCRRRPPDPRDAQIKDLRAELEECKRDAERYRWLRAGWDDVNSPVDLILCNSFSHTLDADIDAAIAEGEK